MATPSGIPVKGDPLSSRWATMEWYFSTSGTVAAFGAELTLVDDILPVRTDDAKKMARRLARDEALFAGTSSGANVVATIHVAEQPGPDAKVVTLMADSGLKYLSTDVYR